MRAKRKKNRTNKTADDFPGYPVYPAKDDIYNQAKEEKDLDPEDPKIKKFPNELPGTPNEISYKNDLSAEDLDIPGSELDDEQENIGSEDEENNFYSLGDN